VTAVQVAFLTSHDELGMELELDLERDLAAGLELKMVPLRELMTAKLRSLCYLTTPLP